MTVVELPAERVIGTPLIKLIPAFSDNGRDFLAGNDQGVVRDEISDNGKARAITKTYNVINVL